MHTYEHPCRWNAMYGTVNEDIYVRNYSMFATYLLVVDLDDVAGLEVTAVVDM